MERHRDGDAGSGSRPAALVVSDVLIYREGIAAGPTRIGDLEVVGAISAEELSAVLAASSVEIVFVDISRERSREAARAARALSPPVLVIGFGMTSEDEGLGRRGSGRDRIRRP